jgi:putative lipoic acid-binding regulatory protein
MLSQEAKDRLRERLDQVHEWPSVYLYKFIFEPDKDRTDAVLALFPAESEVLRKYSAGGKYVSISVKEVMMSADEVVARYDKASEIAGVIVL